MASGRAQGTGGRLGQLWQLPLLLVSLGLFGYAAYLFIRPRTSAPTIEQRIQRIQTALKNERPEAALEQIRALRQVSKLPKEADATAHLLQAEATELLQRVKKQDLPANHTEIIEHTRAALAGGVKADAAVLRRVADSYAALGRPDDALAQYRKAIALDPEKAPALRRKIIDLQLARGDATAAESALDEYIQDPRLEQSERVWAIGEQSRLLADRGEFARARDLLDGVAAHTADRVAQGQVHYRQAYCEWKLGHTDEAERLLRVAREQLRPQHPMDADAAQLLGRILQDKGETREAMSFYQSVIVGHPDSAAAPLARLGRGVCRVQSGEDEPGLSDLNDVVRDVETKPSRARYKDDAVEALKSAAAALVEHANFKGGLEALELQLKLVPDPHADFFAQATDAYARYANQIDRTLAAAPNPPERVRRNQQANVQRVKAGDAAIAYSRKLTASDDKGHADALWRAIELYDQAGDLPRTISALESYTTERPNDGQAPDALLRLGRTYQAAGQFEKAIAALQRNQFKYPRSISASKSGVPLAQCFLARGPEYYAKAEATLLETLESPVIDPKAEDFKDALFELGQLYYRTGRYESAVSRLDEMISRYPQDGRMGQLLFLMADSYRKSAVLLKEGKGMRGPTTAPGAPIASASVDPGLAAAAVSSIPDPTVVAAQLAAQTEAAAQRRDRLGKARQLFDRTVEHYRTITPTRDLDRLYQKLSHFYRADCAYDAGAYEEAIRLYDAAAQRYQDDPSALAAYVQIVNAYCALGRLSEGRAANERAKWLLRRIPPEAFKEGTFAMPKEYWDNWLKWAGDMAM